jgi:FAD/FMN-containing dehydrogenase
VRFDAGSRGAYAHDGSNYRQPPVGVVVPRSADAAVGACREFNVPVLSCGGGTSLAGQCCNEAVVLDCTKYCHQVIEVDPGGRSATVQPGAALDKVNDAVKKYGLMVGPKPSTHVSCTIMIPAPSLTHQTGPPRRPQQAKIMPPRPPSGHDHVARGPSWP